MKANIPLLALLSALLLVGCQPEMPVTSSILIDGYGLATPVNKDMYGVTIEEINHAVDGGIYAELIQNRSFEDGVPPLNSPYDPVRRMLTTPNGWTIPFVRPDSIVGWRCFSKTSYIYPDTKELINDKNRRSLLVSVSASAETGRGGVVAEGYGGIPLREGEKYDLSFYIKGGSMVPKTVSLALADSTGQRGLSEVFRVAPAYEWKKYRHTFTATSNTNSAVLTITTDSSAIFWLDVVSLFPQKTWRERPNGLRPELMELIADLKPAFVRFPGGSFVEGYTAGTYPLWSETIGDISQRKHFWNVWAYGSTNGVGFHEYLQMCEDLGAEPVYVVNSGVTSQSRRPRYEDITAMERLVQEALDAIAYANSPVDSALGALRDKHGHPAPFGLKYVEIGSENYGTEYAKRFELFRRAIHRAYPDVTVISSSETSGGNRHEWSDAHFYATEPFLISNHNRFVAGRSRRMPSVFIGEFGLTGGAAPGSLRAAIGEACFLAGAENAQEVVERVAYAPVLGNTKYGMERHPLISFDGEQIALSPSYYMMQMFAENRGDEVLKTEVQTYHRPQVTFGRAGVEMFDNSYEFREVKIDDAEVMQGAVMRGGWTVGRGVLTPAANRWNYILLGDSSHYDYSFSADIRRTKGSGQIRLRVRDNGSQGEQNDHIGLTLGGGTAELYRQAGGVRDTLCAPAAYPFQSHEWYTVKIVCKGERVSCFINDRLVQEASLPGLPSLVSTAALDRGEQMIILKVINTTQHTEKTALNIEGISVGNRAEVVQLSGDPAARNSYNSPAAIVPKRSEISLPIGGGSVYDFPPNSITIIKLAVD